MSDVMDDEKIYQNYERRALTIGEILEMGDKAHRVMPHNTMRFDVQLSHVYGLIDDGDVTKEQIATAISAAIVEAVNSVCGHSIGGHCKHVFESSLMMHREDIGFDFS